MYTIDFNYDAFMKAGGANMAILLTVGIVLWLILFSFFTSYMAVYVYNKLKPKVVKAIASFKKGYKAGKEETAEISKEAVAVPEKTTIKNALIGKPNGMFVVRREGIEAIPSELEHHVLVKYDFTSEAELYVYPLTAEQLAEIMLDLLKYPVDHPRHRLIRRALTVGSAIFGYAIPQAVVLFDEETKVLHAAFRLHYGVSHLFREWVTIYGKEDVEGNHAANTENERVRLKITEPEIVAAYQQLAPTVTANMLQLARNEVWPHPQAFAYYLLRRPIGQMPWAAEQDGGPLNHIVCMMTAVAAAMQIKVPTKYFFSSNEVVILSHLLERKFTPEMLGEPQPSKPSRLQLVVDNEPVVAARHDDKQTW